MADIDLKYQKPPSELSHFVETFWMLTNHSEQSQSIINLPDGRIDVLFYVSPHEPYQVILLGLDSEPSPNILIPEAIIFAIHFKLPGVEYILQRKTSVFLNKGSLLPTDFWGIRAGDLHDFDTCYTKVSAIMMSIIKEQEVDARKQKLFEAIYASNGDLSVKELSERCYWSSRQINRYFNEQFGLSLKKYCDILRFSASFQHLKEGRLFPEQNFFDQAHFIRDVKRFSGVTPKQLAENKDDRFIQFSTFPQK